MRKKSKVKQDVPLHPEVVEQAVEQEDRSAYNCPSCDGLGLANEKTLCPQCGGTGKV